MLNGSGYGDGRGCGYGDGDGDGRGSGYDPLPAMSAVYDASDNMPALMTVLDRINQGESNGLQGT